MAAYFVVNSFHVTTSSISPLMYASYLSTYKNRINTDENITKEKEITLNVFIAPFNQKMWSSPQSQ